MTEVAKGDGWELRLGDWRTVLADVEACDAVITDPPYSARTHEGHNDGVGDGVRRREARPWLRSDGRIEPAAAVRRAITYALWSDSDVADFVASMSPRCRGWFVSMTSHDLAGAYDTALAGAGRYVFAPLPFLSPGSRVRLSGDGPSSWTCWVIVARPKTQLMQRWGTLPGGYVFPPEASAVVGAKPLGLMRAIVRDYTKPGDLVVDPFCGGGTTALACVMEGRRCITSEIDPETFEKARKRLERGHTRDMFTGAT